MPAIQPARLRQQAALLAQSYDQPDAFVRSLSHLLDYYADRAHRPSQSGLPSPLLKAFNVRPPVLRQLILELAPFAREDPQACLALCDALWAQPFFEFRQLAGSLLGQISPDPVEPILSRVQAWLREDTDEQLLDVVLVQGLSRLRDENPERLIGVIETWLSREDSFSLILGLRALRPLIREASFRNLPVFYRLTQVLVRKCPPPVRPDLLDVLSDLAQRSPAETAYFLRQSLTMLDNPDASWITRQSLHAFPKDLQESLRQALRQAAESRSQHG